MKYWGEEKIGIPQPFRLISGNSENKNEVLEFIDLSLKEVLCNFIFNLKCRILLGKTQKEKETQINRVKSSKFNLTKT